MKKWTGGLLIGCLALLFIVSLFMLVVLKYGALDDAFGESSTPNFFPFNSTNPLDWLQADTPPELRNREASNHVISADTLISGMFHLGNLSSEEQRSLQTWALMKHMVNYSGRLPNDIQAIREAKVAWDDLLSSTEEKRHGVMKERSPQKSKEQCPFFLNKMNITEFGDNGYRLRIPCGLTQGSSITIIGVPNGFLGNFQIDLRGDRIPGEKDHPIILHYNIRLNGDKITENPVIVQNSWTAAHDWGEEERCPIPDHGANKRVDGMTQCNEMVGTTYSKKFIPTGSTNDSTRLSVQHNKSRSGHYFPFRQGFPSVMTLRVGEEGIQMTVDGKHITSFAYRESLEPWFVSDVKISGDLKIISVLVTGLPTSENLEHVVDLEALKSVPIPHRAQLLLFIGVFSTANNFKRRMAVRRTWMQYAAVRSGTIGVRFFVGLHKNQMVNEELWTEAQTYGDIQLMPFVDYYSLIIWKSVGICIFGAEVVSAKYVMKTDDDAFVRVDEVLASLNRINVTHGLLYGLINYEARPHRDPNSKWHISIEEWPEATYPPWAHGPGYVFSNDIAKEVYGRHKQGFLKMFKLEDVGMGIWIADMKKGGLDVSYVKEERVYNVGCKDGYVVAHYQSPRLMLCLWQKLQEAKQAKCCGK